ncbi:MAG: hypothetical protein ACJ74U_13610 [Jatrophihabitantaceae bacterium]
MLASWGFRKETAAPSQACTPRPKGSRRNEPAQLATAAKPPARWLTYLGLITAFITAVVSITIAVATTRSNHQFEKAQAAAQASASQQQAARERKYVAYPKLETDLAALDDVMVNCYAYLMMPVDSGQKYITNPADQQAWIEQHLVTPVRNASNRLYGDSRTQTFDLSSAVEKLLKDMQEQQFESADTCKHFNDVMLQWGNDQGPVARKDETTVNQEFTKQLGYLESETTKITDQINRELQTD